MKTKPAYVEYSSNNSGGSWWLTDEDWKNLEEAGWEVDWKATNEYAKKYVGSDGRYLGALATSAKRRGVSLRVAIAEWEDITEQDSEASGCSCCGSPHNFYAYDDEDRIIW